MVVTHITWQGIIWHSSVYGIVYGIVIQHLCGLALARNNRMSPVGYVLSTVTMRLPWRCHVVRTSFLFLTSSTTSTIIGTVSSSPFQRRYASFIVLLASSVLRQWPSPFLQETASVDIQFEFSFVKQLLVIGILCFFQLGEHPWYDSLDTKKDRTKEPLEMQYVNVWPNHHPFLKHCYLLVGILATSVENIPQWYLIANKIFFIYSKFKYISHMKK